MNSGARNLFILGAASIVIAFLTTTISLVVYHNSGDIYIDRSRPGFLPEKAERKNPDQVEFTFPENGKINKKEITKYQKNFKAQLEELDKFNDPFSPAPLSDESLGIPPGEETPSLESSSTDLP